MEQPALEGRLKSPRVAVGEARELVGRVQLAADVLGQQGDVERLDQLQQSTQLGHEGGRARGLVADDVNDGLIVFPQPDDVPAEVVAIHVDATADRDELLEGDVPLNALLERPPAAEALARTLGRGEDGAEPERGARIRVNGPRGRCGPERDSVGRAVVGEGGPPLQVALGSPRERRARAPLLQDIVNASKTKACLVACC